jgi:hypothetical protein
LPSFGLDKVSGNARNAEAPLNPEGKAAPNARRHEDRAEDPKSARRRTSEQKEMLKDKSQNLHKIRQEAFAKKDAVERAEQVKKTKKTKLELLAPQGGYPGGTNGSAIEGPGSAHDGSAARHRRRRDAIGPTDHWCWLMRTE